MVGGSTLSRVSVRRLGARTMAPRPRALEASRLLPPVILLFPSYSIFSSPALVVRPTFATHGERVFLFFSASRFQPPKKSECESDRCFSSRAPV